MHFDFKVALLEDNWSSQRIEKVSAEIDARRQFAQLCVTM